MNEWVYNCNLLGEKQELAFSSKSLVAASPSTPRNSRESFIGSAVDAVALAERAREACFARRGRRVANFDQKMQGSQSAAGRETVAVTL